MSAGFFGPKEGIDTKDYLFEMEGSTPVSRPESLVGHTLTNANVNLSDALQITRVELKRGRDSDVHHHQACSGRAKPLVHDWLPVWRDLHAGDARCPQRDAQELLHEVPVPG